ncbi:MAG: hypothetical protein R8J94_20935 [Acidimicrobiia bacterium]|nr:hypothetical protein [Acidimicrobiia bacterium]
MSPSVGGVIDDDRLLASATIVTMGWSRAQLQLERRWFRATILAVVVLLLSLPVVRDEDDFPLSTYPMYATARGDEVSLVTAWGRDSNGQRGELGLGIIGSSDDPLIVAGELRSSIRAGEVADRCREIADRASVDSSIVSIEIATERHDVVAHTLSRPSLITRTVHAECPVPENDR